MPTMTAYTVLASGVVGARTIGNRSRNTESTGTDGPPPGPSAVDAGSSGRWIGRSGRGGATVGAAGENRTGDAGASATDRPTPAYRCVRSGDGATLTATPRTPARRTLRATTRRRCMRSPPIVRGALQVVRADP